jgi:hypothetical protein
MTWLHRLDGTYWSASAHADLSGVPVRLSEALYPHDRDTARRIPIANFRSYATNKRKHWQIEIGRGREHRTSV